MKPWKTFGFLALLLSTGIASAEPKLGGSSEWFGKRVAHHMFSQQPDALAIGAWEALDKKLRADGYGVSHPNVDVKNLNFLYEVVELGRTHTRYRYALSKFADPKQKDPYVSIPLKGKMVLSVTYSKQLAPGGGFKPIPMHDVAVEMEIGYTVKEKGRLSDIQYKLPSLSIRESKYNAIPEGGGSSASR